MQLLCFTVSFKCHLLSHGFFWRSEKARPSPQLSQSGPTESVSELRPGYPTPPSAQLPPQPLSLSGFLMTDQDSFIGLRPNLAGKGGAVAGVSANKLAGEETTGRQQGDLT